MFPRARACWLATLAWPLLLWPAQAAEVDYARDVQPLLQRKCFACHSAVRQKGGLRLDAATLLRQGGDSGPALVAGNSAESLLIQKLTAANGESLMPPEGEGEPLKPAEIAVLRSWVDSGAPAPADEAVPVDPRDFWSFQPPRRPTVPQVGNPAWVRTPIDAFVAAEHERRGLTPSAPADHATLLRRVYLDLIGLPPTREELQAFLAHPSPQAYEQVVEQLLDRPQYGERWGRHWMDVWRYSDWYGSGNEIRYGQRHLWRWRDWIVQSLNADKGYDRMILEMLAADELAPTDPAALAATGFIGRNWYKFDRNVGMRELVEHTAVGFLGVTMKCARCHDHKYDPISQEEYYAFRAFFEPHEVRVDRLSMATGYESFQDNGPVLKDGLARVFDKTADAPTYLFARGDDRLADKRRPLAPGVPAALGQTELLIRPVELPPEASQPALQTRLRDESLALAAARVDTSREEIARCEQALAAARQRRDAFLVQASDAPAASAVAALPTVTLHEDFRQPDPQRWQPVSGSWEYRDGRLMQTEVGSFLTLVGQQEQPRDFALRVRYKPTSAGQLHSVGIGFDGVGTMAMQAVYTWIADGKSGVQAFHRAQGNEVYPAAGIVPFPLQLEQEIVLDLAARGSLLNVWVNGQLAIAYPMPMPRQTGCISLWNHSATAEYSELIVAELPPEIVLAERRDQPVTSPFEPPRLEDLESAVRAAEHSRAAAEKDLVLAQAEQESLQARLAAEQARYVVPADEARRDKLARAAARAERAAALAKAERELLPAEQRVAQQPAPLDTDDDHVQKARAEAASALAAAQQAVAAAQAARQQDDGQYTPLGEVYPRTSTGRRLALATWIADPRNPRTARVAINHIWLRHFGRALVESVADFGLRAKSPSHPELLDWLAVEFAEQGWSMKHMHRLLVLSNTYRQSSAWQPGSANLDSDPANRSWWRMNARRMEAEVVRDSMLYLAGTLDPTFGGPELPAAQGQTVLRRSLYFQTAPNRQMEFLALFDVASPEECYERKPSVIPQQSLALLNSNLALASARTLARQLREATAGDDASFVTAAFEQVLGRPPSEAERRRCGQFLQDHARLLADTAALRRFPAAPDERPGPAPDPSSRARENLVQVLFNHNDFLTVR